MFAQVACLLARIRAKVEDMSTETEDQTFALPIAARAMFAVDELLREVGGDLGQVRSWHVATYAARWTTDAPALFGDPNGATGPELDDYYALAYGIAEILKSH